MKIATVLLALAITLTATTDADEAPYQVAYFYKVRWGFQQEFEQLFFKNHYPVLQAQKESGRIRDVQVLKPTFHGDGRGDFTFLTLITFKNFAVLGAPSGEEAIAKRLFPDQESFRREEQRRFELIEAHWDVPLAPVAPPR
ncbi:MAG TPA: hypothetical protein VJU18_09025 [Vicinamibacteria bacterium]|nr:hypothetical protein [Vicinamibacteria bacterium]